MKKADYSMRKRRRCSFVAACNPTIKIEPSDKPIKIDLNVKIDQEIRVKLDKDVEDLIADNPDLF